MSVSSTRRRPDAESGTIAVGSSRSRSCSGSGLHAYGVARSTDATESDGQSRPDDGRGLAEERWPPPAAAAGGHPYAGPADRAPRAGRGAGVGPGAATRHEVGEDRGDATRDATRQPPGGDDTCKT